MSERGLRVWVFIDAQNVYRDARRAFHDPDNDPASYGWYHPMPYGRLVAERGAEDDDHPRSPEEVRVYTGMPSSTRQPKSYGAHMRQRSGWIGAGCKVFPRPLRYPEDWPASPAIEKGVDVALAVDLVFNAARRNFDIGIVASTDTDLVPALEAVSDLRRAWGTPKLEVTSWAPTRKRLRVDGVPIWCHWLSPEDYEKVRDATNYTLDTS